MNLPPEADSWFDQGAEQLQAGAFSSAAASFQAALALAPEFLEARVNLAWAQEQQGALDSAETGYRLALAQAPHCLEAQLNLGALLTTRRRLVEALETCTRAIQDHPESPAAWLNLGALEVCLGHEARAETCLRQALALNPHYQRARINLSYLLLRQGRYPEGWRELEGRSAGDYPERLGFPRWQGQPIRGKRLFIGAEAGHGDMLQMARYATALKAMGAARIGIQCHPALERLFRGLEGVDQVLALDQAPAAGQWDFWTLPFSLPLHCQTLPESIPANLPYLHPAPALVHQWQPRVPSGPFRVGLAWKGNPNFGNDRERSLAQLGQLGGLAAVPGVTWVSLQKGAGETEADHPPPGMAMINLGPQFQDFADTAAVLANLDLVITVDTAVAHLAGALGRPCWVLLPRFKTDWRWFPETGDSLWYPGVMRLFRQSCAGDWNSVMAELTEHLKKAASN